MSNFMILKSCLVAYVFINPIMNVHMLAIAHSSVPPFTFGLCFIFKVVWNISPTFNCSLGLLTFGFGVFNVAYVEGNEDDSTVEE